jgi:hypothetical protein
MKLKPTDSAAGFACSDIIVRNRLLKIESEK